MQLGRARLKRRVLVSRATYYVSCSRPLIQVSFVTPLRNFSHPVLDSGADESFMGWKFAKTLKLKISPLSEQLEANALNALNLSSSMLRVTPS